MANPSPSSARRSTAPRRAWSTLALMERIARTDDTFTREGNYWIGKCLICNGRLSFDAHSGFGANVEHIVPRSAGGDNDPRNLGLTHPRCNGEKGRHWDNKRARRDPTRYEALVARLLERRTARWRDDPAENST